MVREVILIEAPSIYIAAPSEIIQIPKIMIDDCRRIFNPYMDIFFEVCPLDR